MLSSFWLSIFKKQNPHISWWCFKEWIESVFKMRSAMWLKTPLSYTFKRIGKKDSEWTNWAPNKPVLFGVIARSCTKVLRVARFVHSKRQNIRINHGFSYVLPFAVWTFFTSSLATGDSNSARSAFVKNRIFFDCQAWRASAHLRFPHQKSAFFREWRVRRSFCNKFKARQEKSTGNTRCIAEHFDEVLRRICRKNRT